MAQALALQPGIKEYIIEHVARGERLDDLGLGVSHQAISRALKDDPDYQDACLSYHQARLDRSEQMILEASDNVAVAQARAFHDAVRWRASKERRAEYGDKTEISVDHSITVVLAASDSTGRLIEHDVTPSSVEHTALTLDT
jgi:hypothetical protein